MRVLIFTLGLLLAAAGAVRSTSEAAQDIAATPRAASVELLVFEHSDCTYCRVFRSDVVPRYNEGGQAARAPLRFINIERTAVDGLGLNAGIHMVPTFVLMKNGREVDRIVGYWAPDNFFKMLTYILLKAE